MLLCSIPRPSKHANPPLNTLTTHYTFPLVSYPRLAQTLLQQLKDAPPRHTHTPRLHGNSQSWFNYNLVHYIIYLLARLWLMPKAQAMTSECQSVVCGCAWDLSAGMFIDIFCLVEVSRLFLMSEWSLPVSKIFDIKYFLHNFNWTNSTSFPQTFST